MCVPIFHVYNATSATYNLDNPHVDMRGADNQYRHGQKAPALERSQHKACMKTALVLTNGPQEKRGTATVEVAGACSSRSRAVTSN